MEHEGPSTATQHRTPTFAAVNPRVSFPALEEEIEKWWDERGIIGQTLAHGDRANPFVFFEGPPTANNKPGLHHVEARSSKDVIVRFQRMRGHYVVGARAGWDTHGLPVEIAVEQQLGFSGKPDIEKYGIAAFNAACRASVDRYIADWVRLTSRMAFWIDLSIPYITYSNDYIESLWWILKTFWDRGLLFRDYKVTMHCPRCGTSLSDHEVSLGFQDEVDDPSTWLRFRHRPSGHPLDAQFADASFLAWTTTPWTLPANVALAVNPDAPYLLVETQQAAVTERVVLAEALAGAVLGEGQFTVLATFPGRELTGLRYVPLFTGVPAPGTTVDLDQAYRVIADSFVSLSDGTGIVHIAPAYGDLEIGRAYGLPTLFSVDLAGNVLPEFGPLGFGNMFFKQADGRIIENLSERGLLFRSGRVRHAYPFCWRCATPLLYYAKPSWYVRTTARKAELLATNEQIHWVPEHIKHGRFGNWLENNIDWALSRERYWGTPLPIWVCDTCGDTTVIGSVRELSEKAGRDLSGLDLHRPYVDEITWPCKACPGGTMHRVPEVADAWFDSGSMPVAQWHYPFENQELFQIAGQADFISEAIDQTRGWFYTLHAVSTLLFDRPSFRNVICLGHILDAEGFKMSKSRGNVVDPWDLFDRFGADATRWYMYASAPPYNPRRFSTDQVEEELRQFMLTLWNTYAFFVTYANLDGWVPGEGLGPKASGMESQTNPDGSSSGPGAETQPPTRNPQTSPLAPIDAWALARLHVLVRDVTAMLEEYDIHGPARALEDFVEELSNWYVRRNRRRFWKTEDDADKRAAYATLYTCLTTVARLLAPFTPYLSEALYQNLVARVDPQAPPSVHLAPWPAAELARIDEALLANTAQLQAVVGLGRSARRGAGLRVRQPLSELLVRVQHDEALRQLEAELRDELNVKAVRYLDTADTLVTYRIKPNLPVVGRKYGRLVPALRATLEKLAPEVAREVAHRVEAGQPVSLAVNGTPLELAPNELLVEATSPPGYAVAEADGILVALNTAITPELRREGQARDLVRFIQDARKAADLAIADRIEVTLEPLGDFDPGDLVNAFGDYIKGETLATSLRVSPPLPDMFTVEAELDGGSVRIGLRRVGTV